MAIIYGKNTAVDYAAGNLASFGKSYSRMGAAPLDMYEVWYNYDKLVEYASFRGNDANGNPVYDGNTEVVDTSAVTSYVGQKVAYVDETEGKIYHYSIELDGSLKEIGTSPIGDEKSIEVAADGTVSIKGVNALAFERDILDEDGEPTGDKEEVKYQALMTKNGLVWVEPSKTTVEGLAVLIEELDGRVLALETICERVGAPAEGDTSTATLYERIAAEILRATQAEEGLAELIGVEKDGENAATGVYAYVDGVVNTLVNGVDPEKIDSLNELIAWVEAHPAIVEGLDERLEAAEAILEGIGGEGEEETVVDYVEKAIEDYNTNVAANSYAPKQDTLDALDNKIETAQITHTTTGVSEGVTKEGTTLKIVVDAYTKEQVYTKGETDNQIDQKIASVTGGESAADVKLALESYRDALNTEIWGASAANWTTRTTVDGKTVVTYNPQYGNTSRVDQLVEDLGVLDERVGAAKDGEAAATGLFAQVEAAQSKANEAYVKANTNAGAISILEEVVNGAAEDNSDGLVARLAALETEVGAVEASRIDSLVGSVRTLTEVTGEHTERLTTLDSTDLPAIRKAIEDGDKVINDKIGTVATGKTVVGMIDELATIVDVPEEQTVTEYVAAEIAKIESYDDKAVRELIQANAEAISEIDALLNTVSSEDNITSLKELATWVEEHDTDVLPVVEQNARDIVDLKAAVDTGDKTVTEYVTAAIAGIPMATATTLGLVKASNEVTVTNGILGLGEVSTDKLVQGTMTLILDGGDAEVPAN